MSQPASPSEYPGLITLSTANSFEECLNRLRSLIAQKGLTLFLDLDQQAAARSAGLEMPPAQLLLFGSPAAGTPVMVAVPEAGIDLPLKAWLWQNSEGRVYLTYNDPNYVATRFDLPAPLAVRLAGIAGLMAAVVS